ncbi:MAG: PH domain-containing protein [Anaerolineae bacterium]|nr:PH domain-containing protein [Anaerolineae bacterium]
MSVIETKAKVKAVLWQAVAQSGVDVSGLPQAEMDKLVNVMTEAVLREVDDILSSSSGKPASVSKASVSDDDDEAEMILWEGRPFLSLRVYYQITSERIRVSEGLLGKEREDIELVRIQDIDHKQSLTERAFNIGDIYVRSHDPSQPEMVLNNVSNPEEVHEILRRAVLKARKRHGMSYREEM